MVRFEATKSELPRSAVGRMEPVAFIYRFNDALAFTWRAKPFLSAPCFQLARPWTEVPEMSSSKDFIHGHAGYTYHRMFSPPKFHVHTPVANR